MPFFKHCILQTILDIFHGLNLCETKSFGLKIKLYFTFVNIVWVNIWCYSIKGFVFLVLFLKVYRKLGIH